MDPSHPTDDELIDRLTEALTMEGDDAVPEPPAHFERVMWARIRPETTARSRSRWTWRALVPAMGLAAAVVMAVALGNQTPATSTPQTKAAVVAQADPSSAELSAGDRVLLTALDEHLEQTEALLVELRNADRADLRWEQTTADDLVAAGRLYRQSAEFAGRPGVVRMLDDLEPVLVEVARSSDRMADHERDWLRTRIADDNLLFKVRAMSTDLKDLK